jgi:hypothetical protein
MTENPYEAPREPGTPQQPPRDFSLIISIVVALVVLAILAAILVPVGNKA